MGNERRIRTLKIALASYDRKELRVQKHYLEEEDPSIDCECFQSGSRMLQALQSGHVFDIIILCSEMEDMTGLEFLMHARRLTPPPMVLMFDEGRRNNDSALCMDTENGVFYLGQTDLRSLLRQLYRMPGQQGQKRERQCQELCRSWGIQLPDANCSYLTSAVDVVFGSSQKMAIRKEILQAVGQKFGISVSAVDSGIRRMIDQLEASPTEAWAAFKESQKDVEQACFHTLGLISRNCEYLEQHLAHTGADSDSCQAVEDIGAAAARLDRTINEVLTLLEYLRAKELPQLHPMDLCSLLQQITAQADMIQAQLKVELTLDCGGWTTCRVMADRSDAELLLLHLLSNALRACSAGGRVQILLRRSESFWQMTVLDDGCGLPDSSEAAWLENRRCFLGGAKLGLLLSQECCRRMGWGLRVGHAPEKGTQAVVTIPLSAMRVPAHAPELHSGSDLQQQEQQYQLRAMLVRELRTMPERGDPDAL